MHPYMQERLIHYHWQDLYREAEIQRLARSVRRPRPCRVCLRGRTGWRLVSIGLRLATSAPAEVEER